MQPHPGGQTATAPKAKTKPRAPTDARIYAIGDVHGRRDLLDQLLARIKKDSESEDAPVRKVLVLLGDLIDRGPDSKGVMDRAAQLKDGDILADFDVHIMKGNHEDAMLKFLAGRDPADTWRCNGGVETLESYGIDPDQPVDALRKAMLAALPDTHKRLLRDMEIRHTEGDYGFVHAGVKPGVAWDAQTETDMLWIRKEFTESIADFGYVVVHGHTPTPQPSVNANHIGIDTRAWASGKLTCLVLDGEDQRFIST